MGDWFALYYPTSVVYKDAETGEYCGQHSVAKHFNTVVGSGLEPLYVISGSSGSGPHAIFTNSGWYFEVSDDEMERFEIPFELDDSVPIKAHSGVGDDAVVLELSDGRCLFVTMKTDVYQDKWIESVAEIPRYNQDILGFTWWHCATTSGHGLTLNRYDPPKPPHHVEADYQAIYFKDHIYLVDESRVCCLSYFEDRGQKDIDPIAIGSAPGRMCGKLPVGFSYSETPLPERMAGKLPTGFIASADHWTLMISGKSVFRRALAGGFEYLYDLPAEAIECRDKLVLCDNGLIYKLYTDKYIPMTDTQCSLVPTGRKSAI